MPVWKQEDQSFSYSCIHLLTTIMENQLVGKRSSPSATCISFALSSKMWTLILSLMNSNPPLNRKATGILATFHKIRACTQNTCSLADAHLFYKPQRPLLMSIHKCTCTFIGICFYMAILNNNCKRNNIQWTRSASTADLVHWMHQVFLCKHSV